MATRFSADAVAAFDKHFGRPAALALRAVGSEPAKAIMVYTKLGSIWWQEIKPTLPGKKRVLMKQFKRIKAQRDLEAEDDAPVLLREAKKRKLEGGSKQEDPEAAEEHQGSIDHDAQVEAARRDTAASVRIRAGELQGGVARTPILNSIHHATVARLTLFGGFCELRGGYRDGLLVISKFDLGCAGNGQDAALYEGQKIRVKVIEVKPDGKYFLESLDDDRSRECSEDGSRARKILGVHKGSVLAALRTRRAQRMLDTYFLSTFSGVRPLT
jgi:predicted RNA-binding protein with RPS1 domain